MDLDRRLSGALALACAAIVMVVISGGSRPIPGSAYPTPPPPAPAVGDCLLEKPSALWLGGRATVALDIRPCQSDERFGEISSVVTTTVDDVCLDGEGTFASYAGMTQIFTAASTSGWQPRMNVTATILEPDARQRAVGQSWSACLLSPANTQLSYQGTLKDSFVAGDFPAAFAQCQSGMELSLSSPRHCTEPHLAESIGEQVLFGEDIDKAALAETCEQLAATITGMADPTANGQLQTHTTVFPTDQTRMNEQQQPMNVAFCTIGSADGRLLNNTLVGLQDLPIPWAP